MGRESLGEDRNYVVCDDLFKIYKAADLEVVALRGLDLRVAAGELMAIVGPSGSGKTTLLNILAGLETPSAGRVKVGDNDLLRISDRQLVSYRRQEVGFVWQQTDRNLVPYLTALQNVELPLILIGLPHRERLERARELLEAVGLSARMDYVPERLSGGEQQRVAIAIALACNPPLLLADEPTGELDSLTAKSILEILRSLNAMYGVTIIIVTHDPGIMGQVDRVVGIRDGRTSTERLRRPTFRPPGAEADETREEFAVLDSAGRLQIPREYLDKLKMKDRVKVELEGDHVSVWPEHS